MSFQSGSVGRMLEKLNRIEVAATHSQPPFTGTLQRGVLKFALIALSALLCALTPKSAQAQTFGCTPAMANDIVCENSKPGNPSSEWDTFGAGDDTIQGFATDISVNQGQTIFFKINTNATAYTITIYRMGYYGGNGARMITTINPSATLPQTQPDCLTDSSTGLADCGNWAVSASWAVPANATSGIYFAHLVRSDTGDNSHIVFIVRNDSSHSDVLFQTADESWQAYNAYGGHSFYGELDTFDIPNRAFKVSYNRPVITRGFASESATWVFGAEYPMVRWLEASGYNVTYFTGIDAARSGNLILNHKLYMTAGHDEYWSGPHRASVEAARNAGVNMAFFSGNEVFWKTRLENSIDGTNTPNRTLVCYKETIAAAKIDPNDPPTWTGTWRDPRFSPPADGGRPENSLTGTLFEVNGPGSDNLGTQSIQVPAADGKMRFWRNTAAALLAPNTTYTLPAQTLGYEWDIDGDNGSRPAGAFRLSTTTHNLKNDYLLDWGATYGAGTATHHLMMYRAPSGALVFGAGTVQWSWGLDDNHDDPFGNPQNPDHNMQQATVNLFADMGVQPATLQSNLVSATASTDTTPPVSTIVSPASGSTISTGTAVTVTGIATDSGGGVVGGVEVSIDGGNTWHPANGRESWSYSWSPMQIGNVTIQSRAVDDSGNLELASSGVSIITVAPPDCPCSAWSSSAKPTQADSGDPASAELGVKFRADFDGFIRGIRFYKSAANTGTHIGTLWTSTGALLASATFTNETSSGWQQVNFNSPVAITANTTYVASYLAPAGHYSATSAAFFASGLDDPPIHLLQNGIDGPNGLYSYSSGSTFPTSSFNATNYWVDVVYIPSVSMPGAPPALLLTPSSLSFSYQIGSNLPSQSISMFNEGSGIIDWTATTNVPWLTLSATSGATPNTLNVSVNPTGLVAGNYTGTITINALSGNNPTQTVSVSLSVTNLLLSTNFATQGLQGWVVSSLGLGNDWSVVNQGSQYAAQFNGAGNSQIFAGNTAWTDYTVDVPIKLNSMNDYPGGIRGRTNPSTGAGYMLWLYPALGELVLYRASAWDINQPLVQIGAGTAAFDTSTFHHVSMIFKGSQIQALCDGNVAITATDATYGNGLVAIEGLNQLVSFGDVLVTGPNPNTASLIPSATSLSYSGNFGGPNPASQAVQINGGGGGSLAWTALSDSSWLSVTPTSGTTSASIQVSVNSQSLSNGTYNGTITLVALGATNSSQVINVSLNVVTAPPAIIPSPASLSFITISGQAAPPAQTVAVANGGFGSFSYTVTTDSSWLSVSPTSGSTPGSSNVNVNAAGLAVGSYTGNVIITATGVANSPQLIPVTLRVLSQDMRETFTDLGTGWIISPMGNASGWSVSNGVYKYNGSGLSQSCAGNSAWTDYNFDTNIQLSSLSNWPGGVRARVNPATGAGYAVWLYPGSGLAILYKVGVWNINDSSLAQLAQAPLTFDAAVHDLTVSFSGNLITVSWDGRQLMAVNDSSYASGFVCFDADSQPISYSNVRVAGVQVQANLDTPSPTSLTFGAVQGSTPAPQVLNITAGGASTTWAASVSTGAGWLSTSASTTLTPGALTVSVNPTGLAQGVYSATITLSAPGASNSPISIPVTLAVKTAVLSVAPATLNFFGTPTLNPVPQNLQVTNTGTGSLGWSASSTSTWIGLSATTGSAPSTVTVTPNLSTLANGAYSDTITITSPDVNNSPATISVATLVGTLLFSDNFSSGAGNWTVGPLGFASGWSVVNGTYTYNGGGHTQSWAGSSSWTDYTVLTNFQLSSTSDYPGGLRGRLNPTTGASYGAWVYPAQGTIKLFNISQWNIDAGFSVLGTATGLVMDTNVHKLRLSFQGTTIKVYYDEALVITATDSTLAQGAVALDVSNQPIAFDNVSVISLP